MTFSLALEVERPTHTAREKRPGDEVGHFLSNCSPFSGLKCAVSLYFAPERCSEMQNVLEVTRIAENFALNRYSKVTQVF